MFSLTTNAATRIRQAAVEGGMEELALRVAARREADGSITYGMGFDEAHDGEHPALLSDGVTVLIGADRHRLAAAAAGHRARFRRTRAGAVWLRLRASGRAGGADDDAPRRLRRLRRRQLRNRRQLLRAAGERA
ncbi:hypothetical protein [Piscinibacter sp.]|uniref:hypothetical protein n=1 Tax=Piscinibacter sp. TaxID=1903157 RepID=UPI00378370F1